MNIKTADNVPAFEITNRDPRVGRWLRLKRLLKLPFTYVWSGRVEL